MKTQLADENTELKLEIAQLKEGAAKYEQELDIAKKVKLPYFTMFMYMETGDSSAEGGRCKVRTGTGYREKGQVCLSLFYHVSVYGNWR